jgi:tRNA1Val (adenine37-N6)-methyltransferase
MANKYFIFKQFTIEQEGAAFKVTTDSVLLGAWADFSGAEHILDIGTGSGLLALMAAQRCNALITAVEPDEKSFVQAQSNINRSKWASRIALQNCSIQAYQSDPGLFFDTIITNPPFFTGSLLNPDPRKAASRHSFNLSPSELLNAAVRFLKENGTLQVILPVTEGRLFIKEAGRKGFYCNRIMQVKPTPAVEAKRLLLELCRLKRDLKEEVLIIEKGKRHEYSDEYISLTREFYLDR